MREDPIRSIRVHQRFGLSCVSLESGVYKIEIELFGTRKKFDLVNYCITGFTVAIASLKVCILNLRIENGRLKGVRIEGRLCIGTKIGPIKIEKCWNVIGLDINFFTLEEFSALTPGESGHALLAEALDIAGLAGHDFVYVESDIEEFRHVI